MPECPGSHCSGISTQVNAVCTSDGFAGTVVYVFMPDGTQCYCKCSCLAYNTPIAIPENQWTRVQDFKVGDTVLVATKEKSWRSATVAFSDGTGGDGNPVPYSIFLRVESGATLVVTADHPLLTSDGKLKRADRLTVRDTLLNEKFEPVRISEVGFGTYTGGIHHIATSRGGPGEPLWDHLINTAGVISGDYYAQLFLVEESVLQLPQVGAPDYPIEPSATQEPTIQRFTQLGADGLELYKFTPAKKFIPPEGAVSFLPDYMTTPAPGMLQPMDDSTPLEIAENLAAIFRFRYPNVVYHIEWLDNTVNAYAWREGGQRHVALLGGLIRHRHVKRQGLGLVLAHELGHHYGGPPVYPSNGLSCEGTADYWGSAFGMRAAWPGEHYLEEIAPAIDQLYLLFSQGLLMSITEEEAQEIFEAAAACSHPPADCRRSTYWAGARLQPKPGCAG